MLFFNRREFIYAVAIGLGVSGPDEIGIITNDPESKAYADKLTDILMKG